MPPSRPPRSTARAHGRRRKKRSVASTRSSPRAPRASRFTPRWRAHASGSRSPGAPERGRSLGETDPAGASAEDEPGQDQDHRERDPDRDPRTLIELDAPGRRAGLVATGLGEKPAHGTDRVYVEELGVTANVRDQVKVVRDQRRAHAFHRLEVVNRDAEMLANLFQRQTPRLPSLAKLLCDRHGVLAPPPLLRRRPAAVLSSELSRVSTSLTSSCRRPTERSV